MEECLVKMGMAVAGSVIFFAVAVVLLFAGWFAFDHKLKKINFEDELLKGNTAVGVMVAGLLVALGLVIAAAIH